jgi:hypothetical protein
MIAIIEGQSSPGRTRLPGRLVALILATAALLIVAVASAQASSLVYIHESNVWLANPDGSGQYQVTLDGTAGEPYESPSQAQDGTIEAERGGKLYRMAQNGTLLNVPFSTSAVGTPPLDPLISPDGNKVSFWSITAVNPCYLGCLTTASSYQVSYSDHWVDPRTFAPNSAGWSSFGAPTWMSNSRELLFTHAGTMYYYDLGQKEPVEWFTWSEKVGLTGGFFELGSWEEGATSADGTKLALLALSEKTKRYEIQIFSASGDLQTRNPPELPHAECGIEAPDESVGSTDGTYPDSGSLFDSLSFSPDGSSLAYEYNGAIYVAHFTSLADCEAITETQVIAGGSDPNWGPANVNPAPRPPKVNPPPPTPPIVNPPPVVRLTLTSLAQTHRLWREGNKLAQISSPGKRPPIGTAFSFSLNEQASVSFRFTQELSGRKVGGTCVAKTPKNAKHMRCTRTVTAGTLSLTGHSGANKVVFQGRLSQRQKLAPGGYTLTVTATNSAGQTSSPQKLSFTIGK